MKRFLLGMLCLSLLGLGCGGDDDSGDDDAMGGLDGGSNGGAKPVENTVAEKPVEKMVTAKDGGKITAGKAALSIPAGALGEDTMITVKTVDAADLPDADNVAGEAYDFGPDGTEFEKPVTLTLEFDGKAPKDMAATIAWLDGKTWVKLDDSKVTGDTVVASTTHFTTFAVVWMSNGDGTGTQTAGMCEEGMDTTCGGDVVGTWKFSATCVTLPPDIFLDPTNEALSMCKDIVVAADLALEGTITFNGDMTYSSHSALNGTVTASVPKSCLMGAACGDQWSDAGATCEQMSELKNDPNDAMGMYEIAGHTLTTVPEGEDADNPSDFCVRGDTITAKVTDTEDGSVTIYQATRQ